MYYGRREPIGVKITKVTYDKDLNVTFDPPSRIKYPTARQVLREIREEKEIELDIEWGWNDWTES